MSAKVEIKKGSDGKFYAHRKAANGKVTPPRGTPASLRR